MTKKNQSRVQLTERDAEERAAQRHLGGDPPARVVVKHAFDKVSQVIGWNRGIHHCFTGEYVVNNSRAVCLERGEASL